MKIKSYNYKKHLLYFLISTAVFALLNIPSESDFFRLGSAELRLSAVFPVPAGLLMGPAGALGCAVGNILSDCFGHLSTASIFGCLANFLYAWLPYKLWHTILPVEKHKIRFISSADTVLKFIVITMFSTTVSMAVLAAGCELINAYKFFEIFIPTAMCNLFFSLFGGTTLFLVLTKLIRLKPVVPKRLYRNTYIHKRYIPDYILCAAALLLIGLKELYNYSSYLEHADGTPFDLLCELLNFNSGRWGDVFDIILISVVLLLAMLPMLRSKLPSKERFVMPSTKPEISSQIIVVFFIFTAVCSFVLFAVLEFIFVSNKYRITTDNDLFHITLGVFFYVNLIGIIMIVMLYTVLKMLEKKVTKPISCISEYCNDFVRKGLAAELPSFGKTSTEISRLAGSYEKMTADIIRYIGDVQQQAKREERARATLDAAAKIQMNILPKPLKSDSFAVCSYIKPAQAVGGDFYDFAQLDDNRLLVCIADVSSKGLPAAIFMAEASTLVKCSKQLSAELILKNVNNTLCENNSENMFVTMFVGIIDAEKRTMEFANAGHNFPIIRSGGKSQWLESKPNLALGFFPDVNYTLHSIQLESDFELLLYTDGVNEAESINGEFYGNERLISLCDSIYGGETPFEAHLDILINSVRDFTSGAPQSDDITALTIKIK